MTQLDPDKIKIRDGDAEDIQKCLQLDHSYETEYVWQMQIRHEDYRDERNITLKLERLPRFIEIDYPANQARLDLITQVNHCFLVAFNKHTLEIYGYLTMFHDQAHQLGQVLDIVVTREYRHQQIGSRLINVAHIWAKAHEISRMIIETQTKNYPAISFCQKNGFSFCGFNDHYFPNQDIAVFFSQSVR